ncbi:MAG: efflux RND transporter periplasmic adaptor subunit [Candidatus Hydrogenedentes bacterium]|nr:efflux RND transporter periplasmic adaptor subunit [Candidatus Hydrogenedentota bacterium]
MKNGKRAALFIAKLVRGSVWGGAALLILLAGVGVGWFLAPSTPGTEPVMDEHVATGQEEISHWTCSMHPEINLPRPGQCPKCGMPLIPVKKGSQAMGEGFRTFTTSESAKALMNIQTMPVERRFATAEIRMVGKIDYDETKLGYITAWVPGRLDRLYVDYTGIEVNKGDHLVYLYSPELLTAQDELHRAAEAVARLRPDSSRVLVQMAKSNLEAAREKLRRWGLAEEQIDEAEEKGISSDHVTIYAPMGGTVIERFGQEGMWVTTGTRIYTVADLSEVWVKLDAYESDLTWLHYGQKVTITTEAYPGETFEGRIAFIEPTLDATTRTVKVRVNVPNANGKLKPEMFVRATVLAQAATRGRVMDPGLAGKWIGPMHPEIVKDGPGTCDICGMDLVRAEELGYVPLDISEDDKPLLIPVSAALVTGTRAIVYVEVLGAERPTYEGREIVLGPRLGKYYIVRSGLREGERVVTNGNFKIDSALQIMAKPSMMTPDGGGGGGHVHGGMQMKSAGDMKGPAVALADVSKEQLAGLDRAFVAVSEASDEQTKAALISFQEAIDAVEMSLLQGYAHMVWVEYSMRLKNDTVEALDAAGTKRLDAFLELMSNNLEKLRGELGLVAQHVSDDAPTHEAQAPEEFQGQIRTLFDTYLRIHAALAEDKFDTARKATKAALEALEEVDMGLLEGSSHRSWMGSHAAIADAFSKMDKAEKIKDMRAALAPLTAGLSKAIESLGIGPGNPVYRIHCPMALDGSGADWLQGAKKVSNPYLGGAMPTCGTLMGRVDHGPESSTSGSTKTHLEEHDGQAAHVVGGHDE